MNNIELDIHQEDTSSLNVDYSMSINTTCQANTHIAPISTGAYLYTTVNNPSSWVINSTMVNDSAIRVTRDIEFDGDIKLMGRNLGKILEAIENRLAILTPDPKKLEKHEALRRAYDHYLLMEKLIGEDC